MCWNRSYTGIFLTFYFFGELKEKEDSLQGITMKMMGEVRLLLRVSSEMEKGEAEIHHFVVAVIVIV